MKDSPPGQPENVEGESRKTDDCEREEYASNGEESQLTDEENGEHFAVFLQGDAFFSRAAATQGVSPSSRTRAIAWSCAIRRA